MLGDKPVVSSNVCFSVSQGGGAATRSAAADCLGTVEGSGVETEE